MSEKILEIKDERLSFFTPAGEVKALNGVSFSMNQGVSPRKPAASRTSTKSAASAATCPSPSTPPR